MTKSVAETMLKQLKNPFDPKFVKWRVGATNTEKTKGIALAYIDSREVNKRFDEVCGIDGWQDRLIPVQEGFISEIDVKIGDQWITRSNAAGNTKVEPVKGGASDAFKRAAAKWGVGRYLYYLPNIWVPIKQQGKSYVLTEIPELPDWAKPNDNIKNWEDVAELEDAAKSGADEEYLVSEAIDNVDKIRAAQSQEELDAITADMSPDQRVLLTNQINAKSRELQHAAKINADNS